MNLKIFSAFSLIFYGQFFCSENFSYLFVFSSFLFVAGTLKKQPNTHLLLLMFLIIFIDIFIKKQQKKHLKTTKKQPKVTKNQPISFYTNFTFHNFNFNITKTPNISSSNNCKPILTTTKEHYKSVIYYSEENYKKPQLLLSGCPETSCTLIENIFTVNNEEIRRYWFRCLSSTSFVSSNIFQQVFKQRYRPTAKFIIKHFDFVYISFTSNVTSVKSHSTNLTKESFSVQLRATTINGRVPLSHAINILETIFLGDYSLNGIWYPNVYKLQLNETYGRVSENKGSKIRVSIKPKNCFDASHPFESCKGFDTNDLKAEINLKTPVFWEFKVVEYNTKGSKKFISLVYIFHKKSINQGIYYKNFGVSVLKPNASYLQNSSQNSKLNVTIDTISKINDTYMVNIIDNFENGDILFVELRINGTIDSKNLKIEKGRKY